MARQKPEKACVTGVIANFRFASFRWAALTVLALSSIAFPLFRAHAQGGRDVGPPTETLLRVLTQFQGTEVQWPGEASAQRYRRPAPMAAQVAVEMTRSPHATDRAMGMEALSGLDSRSAVRALAGGLVDPSGEVRAAAVRGLNRQDPAIAAPIIVETVYNLSSEEEAGLASAAPSLDEEFARTYQMWLADESGTVDRHVAAAYLLGKLKAVDAAGLLAQRAWARDALLAEKCAEALAALSHESVFPHLQRLTRHPLAGVRIQAVRGLGSIGSLESLEALVRLVQGSLEPQIAVRREAVLQMGQIRRPESVHALMSLLSTRRGLRTEITTALSWLTGKWFGRVARPWQQWYSDWLKNPEWPVPRSSGIEPLIEVRQQ